MWCSTWWWWLWWWWELRWFSPTVLYYLKSVPFPLLAQQHNRCSLLRVLSNLWITGFKVKTSLWSWELKILCCNSSWKRLQFMTTVVSLPFLSLNVPIVNYQRSHSCGLKMLFTGVGKPLSFLFSPIFVTSLCCSFYSVYPVVRSSLLDFLCVTAAQILQNFQIFRRFPHELSFCMPGCHG